MAVISSSYFRVKLPAGHAGVFLVLPKHLCRADGSYGVANVIEVGDLVAECRDGNWYHPSGNEITDLRSIALLERSPELH